jgi:MoaA/NifB/PqqE/SkfB family radical SAM enzyme
MMGAPKPWPTRWPEPAQAPPHETDYDYEPMEDPDYDIDVDPQEAPWQLPEEQLTPYSITWGITHSCNLRCIHCYDGVGHKRHDLSTQQALEVVDRLAAMGISLIAFSGGEPLLRNDIFSIMRRCRERGIQIAMRSNVTLVTRETAQQLAALDLAVAGVSLDGASPHTHDAIRGEGTFEQTQRGIDHLLNAGIRVNIEVVLSKHNFHERFRFITLCEAMGVAEVNFSAITPQGRAAILSDALLDFPLWQQATTELYHASQTAKITVSPSCALVGACWACVEPNITCDGWVTPCYLTKRPLFHILAVPPEAVKSILKQLRTEALDSCGRKRWIDRQERITAIPAS